MEIYFTSQNKQAYLQRERGRDFLTIRLETSRYFSLKHLIKDDLLCAIEFRKKIYRAYISIFSADESLNCSRKVRKNDFV